MEFFVIVAQWTAMADVITDCHNKYHLREGQLTFSTIFRKEEIVSCWVNQYKSYEEGGIEMNCEVWVGRWLRGLVPIQCE